MTTLRIDLRSDTKTRPTAAMRRAMAEAEVGDEQSGEDPSVNLLCDRVAELLGHEAALFLPSGTMANQVAVAVHCRPGDEIVAAAQAHLIASEGAGAAALAGAAIAPLAAPRGIFGPDAVAAAIWGRSRNSPVPRMISIEQTVQAGGFVWDLEAVTALSDLAAARKLALHMDGARLMNAVVASGVSASAFGGLCDSVWLDLSKGLGCPVGAVLAGSADFVEAAWRCKHRIGGAMRQAGILAAAGLYALDHHVDRLAEDHANAQRLAVGLAALPGIGIDPALVETNIVMFDLLAPDASAPALTAALAARGVGVRAESPARLRAVTHLDISREDIGIALAEIAASLAEGGARPL